MTQMLGSINAQAAKNKLETSYEEVKQRLDTFIRQQHIDSKDLPSHKLRKVVMGYNCMTLITDSGRYVHMSAEPGHGDTVIFSTDDYPDIEDAHNLGILSQEQYDEHKAAQQAWLGQRRKIDARSRIKRLILDVGANNVQEYLDVLSKHTIKADRLKPQWIADRLKLLEETNDCA